VALRRFSFSLICLVAALTALAGATTADADVILGSVVQPPGSRADQCPARTAFAQLTSDPSTPYTVPAGDWTLTRWEVNATNYSLPALDVTLVILRPASAGTYDVLATDTEAMPPTLPLDDVVSFTPPSPLAVSGGDLLALYTSSPGLSCFFGAGATPGAATIAELSAPTLPTPGQTLSSTGLNWPPGNRLNLAATIEGDQDVGVAASASPADATVGALAVLGSTVTNHGPEWGPITFADTVPPGLTIESAVAGSGSCATAGQTVGCEIEGLAVGQSAPVSILVTPTAAGSYVNTVLVAPAPGTVDPAPGDDSASATLRVAPAATGPTTPASPSTPARGSTGTIMSPATCVVAGLRRVPLPTARRLLLRLGCEAGKVRHAHSRKVAKGAVIRTAPGRGTYAAGRRVGLVVSSGPPRQRRHRHA
jgi:hypothetical protein